MLFLCEVLVNPLLMAQFVIKLKDKKKKGFFLQLIQQLDFVELVKSTRNPKKAEFIRELIESFEEVKQHQKGSKKLQTLNQLLNEL
jgi:hypothetical protein